jgi:hypothetical protein
MNRLLCAGATVLGLALGVSAQQAASASSTQTRDRSQLPSQTQIDTATPQRSAQSFEGKITRVGDKLVLQEDASQTAYQLDDQAKVKRFEGKSVKVMATVEPGSNALHVVEITPVVTD